VAAVVKPLYPYRVKADGVEYVFHADGTSTRADAAPSPAPRTFRQGYVSGWWWGAACGLVAGVCTTLTAVALVTTVLGAL